MPAGADRLSNLADSSRAAGEELADYRDALLFFSV